MRRCRSVWKKIGKGILFPPMVVAVLLLPISTAFLVYAMAVIGDRTLVAYLSYTLAAYTLTIWCARIPDAVRAVKAFKQENRYVVRWQSDMRLRINVSLYGTLLWNTTYAAFQLCLGLYHASFWYYAMAGYYMSLAIMRFFLLRHSRKHKPGEKLYEEYLRYRACGMIMLPMNLALSVMVFFMVYLNRASHHHEITTIAIATYTFITFGKTILNMSRYRRMNSPVFTAKGAVSLVSASVSMITLTSTMLITFGDGDAVFRRAVLGTLGGVVSVFVAWLSIRMIRVGNRELKAIRQSEMIR